MLLKDKSELGYRVLTVLLTLGNYEFSSYDILKLSNAVDAKSLYTDHIPNEKVSWTHIYAAYKTE